jgi:hypothetical protein
LAVAEEEKLDDQAYIEDEKKLMNFNGTEYII